MAWPPQSGTTTGYEVDGISTILWGTDGLLTSPTPGSGFYVITRFQEKPLVDITRLENGTGVNTSRIFIKQGAQWDITVRDDTQMTPPRPGTTITIVDAGGFISGTSNASPAVYTATVVDASYDVSPKSAAERSITAENLILIDSQD